MKLCIHVLKVQLPDFATTLLEQIVITLFICARRWCVEGIWVEEKKSLFEVNIQQLLKSFQVSITVALKVRKNVIVKIENKHYTLNRAIIYTLRLWLFRKPISLCHKSLKYFSKVMKWALIYFSSFKKSPTNQKFDFYHICNKGKKWKYFRNCIFHFADDVIG